jgi:hypothetical protein
MGRLIVGLSIAAGLVFGVQSVNAAGGHFAVRSKAIFANAKAANGVRALEAAVECSYGSVKVYRGGDKDVLNVVAGGRQFQWKNYMGLSRTLRCKLGVLDIVPMGTELAHSIETVDGGYEKLGPAALISMPLENPTRDGALQWYEFGLELPWGNATGDHLPARREVENTLMLKYGGRLTPIVVLNIEYIRGGENFTEADVRITARQPESFAPLHPTTLVAMKE